MDLSHMLAVWLAGQSPGVSPGGCAVLYAPLAASRRDAGPASRRDVAGGNEAYPFSAGGVRLQEAVPRRGGPHGSPTSRGLGWSAGVALIGELEYGADGLDGFVPRLWSAVGVVGCAGTVVSAESSSPRREAGVGPDPHLHGAQVRLEAGQIGALLNRGAGSVGLSDHLRFVDRFDRDGVLGRARVVGFVERPGQGDTGGGELIQTSADVAVAEFPVMFEKLGAYLRFAVSAQVEGNGYDDLAGVLARCDRPAHAVVVVGLAGGLESRISDVGSVGLKPGDVCHSVVYDSRVLCVEEIQEALRGGDMGRTLDVEGVSWLRREVV